LVETKARQVPAVPKVSVSLASRTLPVSSTWHHIAQWQWHQTNSFCFEPAGTDAPLVRPVSHELFDQRGSRTKPNVRQSEIADPCPDEQNPHPFEDASIFQQRDHLGFNLLP
jgi:hypothetical protein